MGDLNTRRVLGSFQSIVSAVKRRPIDTAVLCSAIVIVSAGFLLKPHSVVRVPEMTNELALPVATAPPTSDVTPPPLTLLRAAHRIQGDTAFSIDSIRQRPLPGTVIADRPPSVTLQSGREAVIEGWAVDSIDRVASRAIFATLDAIPVSGCAIVRVRPDVAKVYGQQSYLNSGFTCTLPGSRLAPGAHVIGLDVLVARNDAFIHVTNPTIVRAR